MPRHPNAYVRAAKPSELPTVADVLTRAFLNDPTMCYYGCAPALVADPDNPEDEETIRGLHIFQSTVMARASLLVGGNADVVVIPRPSASLGSTASPEQEAGVEEEIVAVALWLPPGVTLDLQQAREARARRGAEPGNKPKVGLTWGPTGKNVSERPLREDHPVLIASCKDRD